MLTSIFDHDHYDLLFGIAEIMPLHFLKK